MQPCAASIGGVSHAVRGAASGLGTLSSTRFFGRQETSALEQFSYACEGNAGDDMASIQALCCDAVHQSENCSRPSVGVEQALSQITENRKVETRKPLIF